MEVPHKPEIIPGPQPPEENFPPNKRGGFRGRGNLLRGGPPRGRGGPGGFPGRGGLIMRGPVVGRGGLPGRGALRLVTPGGFIPRGRGIPPNRGRGDIIGVRGDARGGMFRARGGRGGPPGGIPRGFSGPIRPGGPPRGPPGGPLPRGGINRPMRAAPPSRFQQPEVPPIGIPPDRFSSPAVVAPPKRGPPQTTGPPPSQAGVIKRPRYEAPGYSNGYTAAQGSYANPTQMENYAAQSVSYGGNATYGTGGQYPSTYNNYAQPSSNTGSYQPGSGTYPSSYSAQPGYESSADYSHNAYPSSGTDERYTNQYPGQEYSSFNKPANQEAYSYGGPTTYVSPQGGYDERSYGGGTGSAGSGGGSTYDVNQVYNANPTTYAVKPEYDCVKRRKEKDDFG